MKFINVYSHHNTNRHSIDILFLSHKPARIPTLNLGEFDRVIDDFFDTFMPQKTKHLAFIRPQKVFSPPTDVYETEDELVIKLEIAGINPDAVAVSVFKDNVTIRGMRKDIHTHSVQKCSYHLAEINYGVFERNLPLSIRVNERQSKATYNQGFLIITLPRTGKTKTKNIPIKVED